ncbi:glutamate-cysteine ligase family protein [Floricoccus penangensis]|uniref:glutamate-cysteine ligase family protein n=1 Tax=Floricoccus penangensis TaxID=1859475 RepID=UPI00204039C4|nr:glutamate-cysteine ligase family protein [Floricoccus penangensis]URZ88114.1 gamma-glutamylcysteine synthetase [Floricoccus penangensis]
MNKARKCIEERYFKNLKEKPEVFVGVELEFPVVNMIGGAIDIETVLSLMDMLVSEKNFSVEKVDEQGNPIQIIADRYDDRILFEVGYTIIEFAFDKAKNINEVNERFQEYFEIIQSYLKDFHHMLTGLGINPWWNTNNSKCVSDPYYKVLEKYIEMAKNHPHMHPYERWTTFVQSNQVQIDVGKDNLVDVLNVFNKIEVVKAWLFANSYFWKKDMNTGIARDFLWENSTHKLVKDQVGLFKKDFSSIEDVIDNFMHTAIFNIERNGKNYYIEPLTVEDYFGRNEVYAYDCDGNKIIVNPDYRDILRHRTFQYESLTKRGTVEFRSVCTQPISDTFAPTAFHLGIFENLQAVKDLLEDNFFFKIYGEDIVTLRRKFSRLDLSWIEKNEIRAFSKMILDLAQEGLKSRGLAEEQYLESLYRRIDTSTNPAEYGVKLFKRGYTLTEIADEFAFL